MGRAEGSNENRGWMEEETFDSAKKGRCGRQRDVHGDSWAGSVEPRRRNITVKLTQTLVMPQEIKYTYTQLKGEIN